MKQERIIYFQNETNMQHRLAIKMKQKIKKKHRYSWILNIQSWTLTKLYYMDTDSFIV